MSAARPRQRRQLALTLALLLGLTGCEWQTDLVAIRRPSAVCAGASACGLPGNEPEAGAGPVSDCDASDGCNADPVPCSDAADGCKTEPDCSDAAANCGAPPDCSSDTAACQPPLVEQCLARACQTTQATASFCEQDGLSFALGSGCTSDSANPQFPYALCSQTDLIVSAPLAITGDLCVDRDLSWGDRVVVDGELHHTGKLLDAGGPPPQASTDVQGSPACDPARALAPDIGASVRAREADNDNAQAMDAIAQLTRWSGQQSITLPCGRYYLPEIDGDGSMDIQANGHVAIYVAGGVSVKQGLKIHAAPSARVTLVVDGSIHIIGGLTLGELSDARHLLISAQQAHFEQGANSIGGLLYVQSEELLLVNGTLDVRGAVFAYRTQLEGPTTVTSAPMALAASASCNP